MTRLPRISTPLPSNSTHAIAGLSESRPNAPTADSRPRGTGLADQAGEPGIAEHPELGGRYESATTTSTQRRAHPGGTFALVVLFTLPLLAAGAFVLRGAFLIALPVALVVGTTLWLTSARFRSWFSAATSPIETYKGLRLATDVALGSRPRVGPHRGQQRHGRRGRPAGISPRAGRPRRSAVAGTAGCSRRRALPPQTRRSESGSPRARERHRRRRQRRAQPGAGAGQCGSVPARLGGEAGGVPELVATRRACGAARMPLAWFRPKSTGSCATVLGDVAAVPAMADGGVVTGDVYQRIDHGTWLRVKETLEGSRS